MMVNHIMSAAFRSALLGGVLFTMMGCGNSTPGNSDIERVLASGVATCPTDLVIASNVKKTNGIAKGESYQVSYSYDLEFVSDTPDLNTMTVSQGIDRVIQMTTCVTYLASCGLFSDPNKLPKKGDKFSMSSEMTMVRSEKGWIQQ